MSPHWQIEVGGSSNLLTTTSGSNFTSDPDTGSSTPERVDVATEQLLQPHHNTHIQYITKHRRERFKCEVREEKEKRKSMCAEVGKL